MYKYKCGNNTALANYTVPGLHSRNDRQVLFVRTRAAEGLSRAHQTAQLEPELAALVALEERGMGGGAQPRQIHGRRHSPCLGVAAGVGCGGGPASGGQSTRGQRGQLSGHGGRGHRP
jgi:hypothetical protein